jgi:hypothetical protein
MNAQRFQQIRMDVRRTIGRHTLALSLGLSLLIIALAALGYAALHGTFSPEASRTNSARIASQAWPGQRSPVRPTMGSRRTFSAWLSQRRAGQAQL